jgi:hypothetical protein
MLFIAARLSLGCVLAASPKIFFSDLENGPNKGGQNNAGVFVTLYGKRFGTARGTSFLTVGGGRVASYPIWSATRITFQLGPAARTGDIVVTTAEGVSNGVPFTVRSGGIYFVATHGSDTNDGSFGHPWRSLLKARNSIGAGDTVYAMDGVSQTADDGQGWATSFLLRSGGTPGAPMAIVAYPGASVTIGSSSGPAYGIRVIDSGTCPGNWVFAGLILRGLDSAMVLAGPSINWRVIGNDMSCPTGNGEVGCFATSKASYVTFYGNNVHDVGAAGASAHYQGVYWSTDSNHIDMGWNTVANVRGCRGIQTHSSPLGSGGAGDSTGHNLYDLIIHDNVIHDTQCDGIILATVDPSLGKIQVFNNIIYNAGKGPNNPEQTGAWTCINVPGITANGSPGGGMIDVFNNTMYNCGSFVQPPYSDAKAAVANGGYNRNLRIRIHNNIIYQTPAAPYLVLYNSDDGIFGSNNLFFGNGAPPSNSGIAESLNTDPLFSNLPGRDWRLTSGSAARRAGVNTGVSWDLDGRARGGSAGYDLGALQFVPPEVSAPACDPSGIRMPGTASCTATISSEAPNSGLELAVGNDSAALQTPGSAGALAASSSACLQDKAVSVRERARKGRIPPIQSDR